MKKTVLIVYTLFRFFGYRIIYLPATLFFNLQLKGSVDKGDN